MIRYILFYALPTAFLLAGPKIEESDYTQRLINFIMFIGILYYLLKDKVRDAFVSRRDNIKNRYETSKKELKNSIKERENISSEENRVKTEAKNIVSKAKKEATDIIKKGENEIPLLKEELVNSYELKKQQARANEEKSVIKEYVNKTLNDTNIADEVIVNLMLNKVLK